MAKAPIEIKSLARVHTESALRTLVGVMQQPDAPAAARVSAAQALLDRGWGKAESKSEVTLRKVIARELNDDELASIAIGGSEGTADAAEDTPVLN